MMTNGFYVVRSKKSGKFADGYYGWDSTIHSEKQIFSYEELPYYKNDRVTFIFVGHNRPSVREVKLMLEI